MSPSRSKDDQKDNDSLPPLHESILRTLLKRPKSYGLDIMKHLNATNEQHGRRKVGAGSLYPALHKLEEKGWIRGDWDDEPSEGKGARRRYYVISGEGRQRLADEEAYRLNLSSVQDGGLGNAPA